MQPRVVLFLTMAILPGLVASTTSSLINTTCSKTPNVSYDYCIKVLSANPAGASATDKRGLAIATAKQTVHNVTSTVHMMSDLIHELNTCIKYYRHMGELTMGAIDDLHAGRDAGLIYLKLQEASNEPLSCDIALFRGIKKNPMEKENLENKNLADLASSITFMLFNRRS